MPINGITTELISETLKLRHELANLLDFPSYADKSLATKMAESPSQVIDFLDNLAGESLEQAKNELAELS